jgi:hydrogenase expression/formation protein HypD
MKHQNEYRDPELARLQLEAIRQTIDGYHGMMTFMEVCGTHTMAIYQHGIRSLLPEKVQLISGPGCPVCVTPVGFVDQAVALARRPDTIIATFGDMVRVPGSSSSLLHEQARGASVKIVYSPLDAVALADRSRRHTDCSLEEARQLLCPLFAQNNARPHGGPRRRPGPPGRRLSLPGARFSHYRSQCLPASC